MHRPFSELSAAAAFALLLAPAAVAHADADRPIAEIFKPIPLTDRVRDFYGSIEARTLLNLGMNNLEGFGNNRNY